MSVTTDGWTSKAQDWHCQTTVGQKLNWSFHFKFTPFFMFCFAKPSISYFKFLVSYLVAWELTCKVLSTRARLDRHTTGNLAVEVNDTMKEFCLENHVFACNHDNAANFNLASRMISKSKEIPGAFNINRAVQSKFVDRRCNEERGWPAPWKDGYWSQGKDWSGTWKCPLRQQIVLVLKRKRC